jgi:hypothetical protein
MRLRKRYLFSLLAVLVTALAPVASVAAAPSVTVVTSGLEGPRSVAFIDRRAVVSESGTGGPDCFISFLGNACVGKTSQVTWVDTKTGAHKLLAGGFFSMADPEESLGVSGLAVLGHTLYAQISVTSREIPPAIAAGHQAGDLIAINPANGSWKTVAKVGDLNFDFTTGFTEPTRGVYSPGTQEHDANPTGLLASDGFIYVADSGANLINRVTRGGKVSRVHYFPWRDPNPNNFPSDEVPTCIARADDGFWVGTLAGHLFRLDDEGSATQVVPKDRGGRPLLTHVTGCTSGEDGTLYLVQMFGGGRAFQDPSFFIGSVVTYQPQSGRAAVLADTASVPTLFLPYSAAIGPDGNLYVVAGAICGAQGQGPPGCTSGNVAGGRLLKINLPYGEDDKDG